MKRLCVFFLFFVSTLSVCSSASSSSQAGFWQQTNGPEGAIVNVLIRNAAGYYFAGFRSARVGDRTQPGSADFSRSKPRIAKNSTFKQTFADTSILAHTVHWC